MSSILWLSLVMFISPYSKLGLSGLVFALQAVDLLDQLLLPLQSLLCRLLKLLHVLTNSLKLLLDSLQVLLSQLSSVNSPLQFSLLNSKFPGQLVQLLFIVGGHLDGGSQVLVQLLNGDLVVEAGSLNNLDGLEDVISGLGGHGQLGDGGAEGLSRLLVFLLHQHDPPGECGDIALNLLELLLSLLKGFICLGELVIGLVEANLKLLDLLAVVPDIAVSLVCSCDGLSCGLLEASDGLV